MINYLYGYLIKILIILRSLLPIKIKKNSNKRIYINILYMEYNIILFNTNKLKKKGVYYLF